MQVPSAMDDGSCNFTCPTLAAHYELLPPGVAEVGKCVVYNPNNWFEWRGLLEVSTPYTNHRMLCMGCV
jgi:hypothetical protein